MKEIVIKIDDVDYEYIKNGCVIPIKIDNHIYEVIRNGKVLPKRHGRIGDVTELQKTFHNLCDAYGIDNLSFISDMDMNFDLIPNLVEADKEEE